DRRLSILARMSSEILQEDGSHQVDVQTSSPIGPQSSEFLSDIRWTTSIRFILLGVFCLLVFSIWVFFGRWPDPQPSSPPWKPDAIVALGGGTNERNREVVKLHRMYPEIPIVVSGDSGTIVAFLDWELVPKSLVHHENEATNTLENARFTQPIFDSLKARRVLIVTDWYHTPRALATFRHEQPKREFAVSFETRTGQLTKSQKCSQRHERLAAVWYLFRYGVRSF
ncbi:MAG: YdcF family protein, partial [Luteolibacter sp.]